MLTLDSVSKAYAAPVISNFSYSFPENGLFLLRAPSGKGKTTLLRLIAGLDKPDSGRIYGAEDKKISAVFQDMRLIEFLTVLDNLLLVREKSRNYITEAKETLGFLGLRDAAEKFPPQLSGGMKERVAIARSLFYGGDIFLWDEPTKELDAHNKSIVIQMIRKLSEKRLFIVATHDESLTGGTVIRL